MLAGVAVNAVSRARGKPRAEGVTSSQLRSALDTTGAEYAIFWRWSSVASVLKAEAWYAHDGTLMEPDVGRRYAHGQGDVGSVWASKGTQLVRNVRAVDIKTFARLQLAMYYRIKSVAFAHCQRGEIEGVLELGSSKLDWTAVPACDLFTPQVRATAAKPHALEVSGELLQSVVETSGAEYAIYWQNFGQVGELKAVRFYARDGTCMRRSQTFSINKGDPIEQAWRLRTPTLLPDASTLEIAIMGRLPLIKHHKIRSIALHPLKHGVVEIGTTELWSVVPALTQLDALERESAQSDASTTILLGMLSRARVQSHADSPATSPTPKLDQRAGEAANHVKSTRPEPPATPTNRRSPRSSAGRRSIERDDGSTASRADRDKCSDLNGDASPDDGGAGPDRRAVPEIVARMHMADEAKVKFEPALPSEATTIEARLTASLLRPPSA